MSTYDERHELIARYLAYEYEQPINSARVRASEIMAIVHTGLMADSAPHELRPIVFHEPEGPVIPVGTPVYGETTDGLPFTLCVTRVAEDGKLTIEADQKPTEATS